MSENKLRASIIIPHYNQTFFLGALLQSVADQTIDDYEVIVIDDCTPDRAALEDIKRFVYEHPNMRFVENSENMRFIKTCNKGIQLARGDYICLLNSDTRVKSRFIERSVEILDGDASIAGLTCIVVDRFGQIWFSGGRYSNGEPANLTDDFQGLRQVDFVAGTAVFYRKEIFDRIGLFDESYGMYHEDVEFGLRVRAKTDCRLCVFSDKLVTHFWVNSIPGPQVKYYLDKNLVLLARKYAPVSVPKLVLRSLIREVIGRMVYFPFAMLRLTLRNSACAQLLRQQIRSGVSSVKGTFAGLFSKQDA